MKYTDIDDASKGDLTAFVEQYTDVDPKWSAAKLKAKAKGIITQMEEEKHAPVVQPEQEAPAPAVAPSTDHRLDAVIRRLEALEAENESLRTQVDSRRSLSKAQKLEENFQRCRISNHFRDPIAEDRIYKSTGRREIVILPRDAKTELEAFTKGNLKPCAPNGGMYWLKNKEWHASPTTGKTRQVTTFSRYLYCDYSMEGNKHRRVNDKYDLVDVYGKSVKPFAKELPLEDLDNGIPYNPKAARKVRIADVLGDLSELE